MLVGVILTTPRPQVALTAVDTGLSRSAESPAGSAIDAGLRPAMSAVEKANPATINFADIAARLNPAVVNIDASARGQRARGLTQERRAARQRRSI